MYGTPINGAFLPYLQEDAWYRVQWHVSSDAVSLLMTLHLIMWPHVADVPKSPRGLAPDVRESFLWLWPTSHNTPPKHRQKGLTYMSLVYSLCFSLTFIFSKNDPEGIIDHYLEQSTVFTSINHREPFLPNHVSRFQ